MNYEEIQIYCQSHHFISKLCGKSQSCLPRLNKDLNRRKRLNLFGRNHLWCSRDRGDNEWGSEASTSSHTFIP
jgi:hypothetical protein